MTARVATRRVAVLRTSRFVGVALAFVRTRWPDADIRVVYQTGAETELRASGVTPDPVFALRAGARITAASLLRSGWGWQLLRWRPHEVVVQWWHPSGDGHEGVDRAALLLHPSGFHAVLEDGSWIRTTAVERLTHSWVSAWRLLRGGLIVLIVAMASAATWPAAAWFDWRDRRRVS